MRGLVMMEEEWLDRTMNVLGPDLSATFPRVGGCSQDFEARGNVPAGS